MRSFKEKIRISKVHFSFWACLSWERGSPGMHGLRGFVCENAYFGEFISLAIWYLFEIWNFYHYRCDKHCAGIFLLKSSIWIFTLAMVYKKVKNKLQSDFSFFCLFLSVITEDHSFAPYSARAVWNDVVLWFTIIILYNIFLGCREYE